MITAEIYGNTTELFFEGKRVATLNSKGRAVNRLVSHANDFIDEEYQKGAKVVKIQNPLTRGGHSNDLGMVSIGCFDDFGDLSGGIGLILKDFE